MVAPTVKKMKMGETQFDKLAELTTIVADTGEIAQIKKYKPTDATTNPSLLYKAASAPEHQDLVNEAIEYGKGLKGARVVIWGDGSAASMIDAESACFVRRPRSVQYRVARTKQNIPPV